MRRPTSRGAGSRKAAAGCVCQTRGISATTSRLRAKRQLEERLWRRETVASGGKRAAIREANLGSSLPNLTL